MISLIKFSFFILFFFIQIQKTLEETKEDYQNLGRMNFIEYVRFHGYLIEEHFVTTSDGYILRLFRVQGKQQEKFIEDLPVLYIQHGFGDSCDNFIVNSEEQAPGFFFARKGFDVWFGNHRGNKHSRNHTILDPDKDEVFWNFNIDDLVNYDIPTMTEFIFQKNNYRKINYIGYSQGATVIFLALSSNQNISQYLEKVIVWGPVIYLKDVSQQVKRMGITKILDSSFLKYSMREIVPSKQIQDKMLTFYSPLTEKIFKYVIQLAADENANINNLERTPVIIGHYPGGTSYNVMSQWNQQFLNNEYSFRKFDFGEEENLKKYGKSIPPEYDFNKIEEIPIYMNIGLQDKIANQKDCNHFIDKLKFKIYQRYYYMGHGTFVWGKNLRYFLENNQMDLIFGDE